MYGCHEYALSKLFSVANKVNQMGRPASALMVLALLFSGTVSACGGETYPIMSTHKDDGSKIGLFISRDQIEKTQAWTPGQEEPPLSISTAYNTVKEWGRQHYTRYDDVKVQELSLKKYGCSLVSDRWYYVFSLRPVIDGNELWSSGNWAAVLMDGTVIGSREY